MGKRFFYINFIFEYARIAEQPWATGRSPRCVSKRTALMGSEVSYEELSMNILIVESTCKFKVLVDDLEECSMKIMVYVTI